MGTTFTHKLLLEGWDRIRFGLKPHSEWCTLIVAYGFDPKTLIAFYIPVIYPTAGLGIELLQGLLIA